MILTGDVVLTIRNPKLGNLVTTDLGLTQVSNRTGATTVAKVAPRITRRRWDFESLSATERADLETFFSNNKGIFKTDMTLQDKCGTTRYYEYCIFDNQELEFVNESDLGCGNYTCSIYVVKIASAIQELSTEAYVILMTEAGVALSTEGT
jgi:hypothetical protein